jgi:signal recognition particle receptor subunit beta
VAVYDPESKKLIVRVVYDGPGMAGKTTNLQQMCALFAPDRRSDLYNGLTAASRTLCLDWMQLDGGRVSGHELRCHLLTVPGQAVLERRRQMLLSMADSIVFVLDSSEEGLHEALPMWRSLLACTGGAEAGVPVLIQANKQDLSGALAVAEIRQRWTLGAGLPIIAASAASGQGVRETVVRAIRGAVLGLQEDLATRIVSDLEGRYETGQELERRILAADAAPPAALDTFRAPLGSLPSSDADRESASARRASPGKTPGSRRLRQERSAQSGVFVAPSPRAVQPSAVGRRAGKLTLPSTDAGTGLVWPAIEGRRTLRVIPFDDATRHQPEPASKARGGQRGSDEILFKAGIWCLKTSRECCFPNAERAQSALVRLAHAKLELGSLCVPRTVLVVQRASDETYWLWTISLWLSTLRGQLEYALERRDEAALSDALGQYARLIVRALRMCLDQSVILDLRPDHFGLLCDEAFYLDDDLARGTGHAAAI